LVRNLRTYYVSGWISDESFRKLMKFSDYLGRDRNGLVIELNLSKALKNGVQPEFITSTLGQLGVSLSDEDLRSINELIGGKHQARISLNSSRLIVSLSPEIGDAFDELTGVARYDPENRVFFAYPFVYPEVKQILTKYGLRVLDEVGRKFPEVHLRFKGCLRDYQEHALREWQREGMKGVISLPTGSGKTVIGVAAIALTRSPTLVVTFTKDQMWQWESTVSELLEGDFTVGLFYSDSKQIRDVTISTYQTAYKHPELYRDFDFLIVDEVHHLPAEKFKSIAMGSIASKRMGLSATPYRTDGRHHELFKLMGGLVYHKGVEELRREGYLADYEIVQVKVDLTQGDRLTYKGLTSQYQSKSKGRTVDQLIKAANKGDLSAMEALRILTKLRKLAALHMNKLSKVRQIVSEELSKGNKVLVFTQYRDHAEALAKTLNALSLTGDTPDKERESIIREFRESKSGVLVLTTVGDEGLDIPDANVGILISGSGSKRQFVQRLGRLLRNRPGKRAVFYELVSRGTLEESQSRRRKRSEIEEIMFSADNDLT
jgi:superfamily II DNA or RNA helicase